MSGDMELLLLASLALQVLASPEQSDVVSYAVACEGLLMSSCFETPAALCEHSVSQSGYRIANG